MSAPRVLGLKHLLKSKCSGCLGGTVVGMTGIPEAVLARELEMCYASICTVSNYAASISPTNFTIDEVFEIMDSKKDDLVNTHGFCHIKNG